MCHDGLATPTRTVGYLVALQVALDSSLLIVIEQKGDLVCTRLRSFGCGASLHFLHFVTKVSVKQEIKKKNRYICCLSDTKMAKHFDIGKEGESLAREYLISKGYNVIETNWHWHHFELDIVAVFDDMLVVVEVKTRSADFLLSPEEAVDRRKRKRIVAAADAYVRRFNVVLPVRFDIVTVIIGDDGIEIDHLDDAFYPSCM